MRRSAAAVRRVAEGTEEQRDVVVGTWVGDNERDVTIGVEKAGDAARHEVGLRVKAYVVRAGCKVITARKKVGDAAVDVADGSVDGGAVDVSWGVVTEQGELKSRGGRASRSVESVRRKWTRHDYDTRAMCDCNFMKAMLLSIVQR